MKTTLKKQILLILFLSICFTYLYAENLKTNSCGIKSEINNYLNVLTENKLFNGSVLLAKEGKVFFTRGFGMADFTTAVPNTKKTVYMIASLTKSFAAYSILLLEERGLLCTEDTVDMYVPELPVGDNITIHQLLNHSSGLYNYTNNPAVWAVSDKFHYPSEILPYFADYPLDFPPGSDFSYSNSGYIVLGIIIERITGRTFGEFIEENITNPLKLKNTGFTPGEGLPLLLAAGYDDITTEPPLETMELSPSVPYTSGGMYSNVYDLFKWSEGLFTNFSKARGPRIPRLSPDRWEKIFTPGLGSYGYGWFITETPLDGKIYNTIFHSGGYLGYHGIILKVVDEDLTIIIEENHNTPSVDENMFNNIIMTLATIILK